MASLILHELTPSPNNVKARIALGFKGLQYERKPLQITEFPGDRSSIVALSGQPRLPVLQHGDTLVPDSNAIMRYLDANFRDTPALFSADFAEYGEIEGWLAYRMEFGKPMGIFFPALISGQMTPEVSEQASAGFHEVTGPLEEALASSDYLVGDRLTAADVTLAPMTNMAMLNEQFATVSPFLQGARASLNLGDGRDRVRAWVERVIAHDPVASGKAVAV